MLELGARVAMASASGDDQGTVTYIGKTGCVVEWDDGYEMFYRDEELQTLS